MNKVLFLLTFSLFFSANELSSYAKTISAKKNLVIKNDNYDYLFSDIKKNYGIKVYYKDTKDFFPEYWHNKSVNPKLSPISLVELKRFPKLLDNELKRYSIKTIKKYLKGIHLAKSLSFYSDNVIFGATNSGDGIYITSDGIKKYYTDKYLIHIFHHEFSSILLRDSKFPQDEWESWNSRGFVYDSNGIEALRKKKGKLFGEDSLYSEGILSEYSLASFEEDFNVYSGMIFSEPKEFLALKNKYPVIKEKFNIWLKFYNSLDPIFTEEYLLGTKDNSQDK